ncbi:MAG: CDP-glycerol glycerophosphotransferase family protein, partial [Rhodospirillales bacterium]
PNAVYVQTRNSMVMKNYFLKRPNSSDFICAPSDFIKKQYVEKNGLSDNKVWVTGYIGNDDLFNKRINALAFDLPIDKKVVLYAPTFTPTMTSTEMLGDDLISLIRGALRDVSIIIKPHPNFCDQPSMVLERWRQMANIDPDVYLIDDPESATTAAIQASDVLISDASGVIFQYLTVDRPIVLLSNPLKSQDIAVYDPQAPEWAWRDVGDDLTNVQDLTQAVAQALDDPRSNADLRAKYRNLMFGEQTTGDAVQRIVENIAQLNSKN